MFARSPCCKNNFTPFPLIIAHNKQAQTALCFSDCLIGKCGRVKTVGYVLLCKSTITHANQQKKEARRSRKSNKKQKRNAKVSILTQIKELYGSSQNQMHAGKQAWEEAQKPELILSAKELWIDSHFAKMFSTTKFRKSPQDFWTGLSRQLTIIALHQVLRVGPTRTARLFFLNVQFMLRTQTGNNRLNYCP